LLFVSGEKRDWPTRSPEDVWNRKSVDFYLPPSRLERRQRCIKNRTLGRLSSSLTRVHSVLQQSIVITIIIIIIIFIIMIIYRCTADGAAKDRIIIIFIRAVCKSRELRVTFRPYRRSPWSHSYRRTPHSIAVASLSYYYYYYYSLHYTFDTAYVLPPEAGCERATRHFAHFRFVHTHNML